MFRKIQMCVLALAVVGVLSYAQEAKAATTSNCTVTSVNVYNNRVAIICSGVSYWHQIAGPGWSSTCPAVTVDTLKMWESMAQSALLSGRKLNITYSTAPSTCTSGGTTLSGQRLVTGVSLISN